MVHDVLDFDIYGIAVSLRNCTTGRSSKSQFSNPKFQINLKNQITNIKQTQKSSLNWTLFWIFKFVCYLYIGI